MPLHDLKQKIAAAKKFDVSKEVIDILNKNADVLTDLLRHQMMQGLDGDDNPKTLVRHDGVFETYAARTIKEKETFGVGLGSVIDRITHYMTGDFYASFKLKTVGDTFEIISDVPYYEQIISHSGTGDKIMEIGEEYMRLFIDEILIPELDVRFEKHLNGL